MNASAKAGFTVRRREPDIGKKHIEWAGKSINPISGCNGPEGVRCGFCFAHRISYRLKGRYGYPEDDPFKPTWHPEKLIQILKRKKPTVWFFGSMCDHCDDGVEPEWRQACYKTFKQCSQHVFVTLTKQYGNMWKIAYDSPDQCIPPNVIVGISVTNRSQVWGVDKLREVKSPAGPVRLLCYEPALEDISNITELEGIDWLIIGAQSKQPGTGGLGSIPYVRPEKVWVDRMIEKARALDIPVFLKPNLNYLGDWTMEPIEEVPYVVRKIAK